MRDLAFVVDRMSPSKLELFERCQESFLQRYVLGHRSPPRASNALGNAVDATTNGVYFAKLQTHDTAPAKDVQARFADWWSREAVRVETWDEDEKPGEILDRGVRSMAAWRDRIAVRVQPTREPQVAVEIPVTSADPELDAEVGLAPAFIVTGVFDVVATVPTAAGPREAIIDHKASGKTWHVNDVLRSAAAPVYSAGTKVPLFQFHVLRTNLVREARTTVISAPITQTAIDHVLKRMAIARRAIARCYRIGDWIPNRNQFLCSRTWCGFWQACERRHGGTVTP